MREKVFNVCAYDTERRRTDDTNRAVLHFQPAANRTSKTQRESCVLSSGN